MTPQDSTYINEPSRTIFVQGSGLVFGGLALVMGCMAEQDVGAKTVQVRICGSESLQGRVWGFVGLGFIRFGAHRVWG